MLLLSVALAAVLIVALFVIGLRLVPRFVARAGRLSARLDAAHGAADTGTQPALCRLVRARTAPTRFRGLPLTLLTAAALYLAALMLGLTEDVLEADKVVTLDRIISALFDPWRAAPVITVFRWITAFGASPAIVASMIIATGFLFAEGRRAPILPLWITLAGAEITMSLGKLIVARPRPEAMLDTATFWSFPSGHATVAMAVYGYLAYAIARDLPNPHARFAIAYCTAVMIGLIGLSRVILNVHYASDIVGGFLVGGFWLLIGVIAAELLRPHKRSGQAAEERERR
ncbi:MAG: phosphoesterase PA-phosphatase [Confluentimicrobium sp.]|uniref:phosphatase PAP2 family protein n=1 Tax=Actibacterium sp. TaxID=1872125 RepID=UPI000C6393F4|nr:phosphatase PAP2 family protein [Actibacterium sp.]MBC58341.1 phosphoesterase PA-phosphatase [Actibacterium sp.]